MVFRFLLVVVGDWDDSLLLGELISLDEILNRFKFHVINASLKGLYLYICLSLFLFILSVGNLSVNFFLSWSVTMNISMHFSWGMISTK